MPKPSSNRPPSDPILAARHVIDSITERDETHSQQTRIHELERVCREVAEFARVGELPARVVATLDAAGAGEPIEPASLLPITPDDFKDARAVTYGRAGGLKGGKARAESLTGRRRAQIARQGAAARWKDHKRDQK